MAINKRLIHLISPRKCFLKNALYTKEDSGHNVPKTDSGYEP